MTFGRDQSIQHIETRKEDAVVQTNQTAAALHRVRSDPNPMNLRRKEMVMKANNLIRAIFLMVLVLSMIPTPAQAKDRYQDAPKNFEVVDSAQGVAVHERKDGKAYIQEINLDQALVVGMTGQSLGVAPNPGIFGGADTRFAFRNLNDYWKQLSKMGGEPMCLFTGQFFTFDTEKVDETWTTRLAHPLKIDNTILTYGWETDDKAHPGEKVMVEMWPGEVRISPLSKEAFETSTAPNIFVGLDPKANKKPEDGLARTFVGFKDQNGDGKLETMLVLSIESATQSQAENILRQWGATEVVMFDGGGSTKLLCRRSGQPLLEKEEDRVLPMMFGVVARAITDSKPVEPVPFSQIMPTDAEITGRYYEDYTEFSDTEVRHTGVDIGGGCGAEVKAAARGTVVMAQEGWFKFRGWVVAVLHGFFPDSGVPYVTYYAHLSDVPVKVGQVVEQGQVLGKTMDPGPTIAADGTKKGGGCHLHWGASNMLPSEYVDKTYYHASENNGRGWMDPLTPPTALLPEPKGNTHRTAPVDVIVEPPRPWRDSPVDGGSRCGAPFGEGNALGGQSFHNAVDICFGFSSPPAYAVAWGEVVWAGQWPPGSASTSGHGKTVVIKHPDSGLFTYYAHLDSISVQEGMVVEPGQEVGKVGNSGYVKKWPWNPNRHLHFAVRTTGPQDTGCWSKACWQNPDDHLGKTMTQRPGGVYAATERTWLEAVLFRIIDPLMPLVTLFAKAKELLEMADKAGLVDAEQILALGPKIAAIGVTLVLFLMYLSVMYIRKAIELKKLKRIRTKLARRDTVSQKETDWLTSEDQPERHHRFQKLYTLLLVAIVVIWVSGNHHPAIWRMMMITLGIKVFFFVSGRSYNGIWRYYNLPEIPEYARQIVLVPVLAALLAYLLGYLFVAIQSGGYARALEGIDWSKPGASDYIWRTIDFSKEGKDTVYAGVYGHIGPGGWATLSECTTAQCAVERAGAYAKQVEGWSGGKKVVPVVNLVGRNEDDQMIQDVVNLCSNKCVVMIDISPQEDPNRYIDKWTEKGEHVWFDLDLEHLMRPTRAEIFNAYANRYFSLRQKLGYTSAGVFGFYDFRVPGWLQPADKIRYTYPTGMVIPIYDGHCQGSPCKETKWNMTKAVLGEYPQAPSVGIMEFLTKWGCGSKYGDCGFTTQEYFDAFKDFGPGLKLYLSQ